MRVGPALTWALCEGEEGREAPRETGGRRGSEGGSSEAGQGAGHGDTSAREPRLHWLPGGERWALSQGRPFCAVLRGLHSGTWGLGLSDCEASGCEQTGFQPGVVQAELYPPQGVLSFTPSL